MCILRWQHWLVSKWWQLSTTSNRTLTSGVCSLYLRVPRIERFWDDLCQYIILNSTLIQLSYVIFYCGHCNKELQPSLAKAVKWQVPGNQTLTNCVWTSNLVGCKIGLNASNLVGIQPGGQPGGKPSWQPGGNLVGNQADGQPGGQPGRLQDRTQCFQPGGLQCCNAGF